MARAAELLVSQGSAMPQFEAARLDDQLPVVNARRPVEAHG